MGSARAWGTITAVVVTVAVVAGNSVAAVVTPVMVVAVVAGRRSCGAHMAATLLVQSSAADVFAPTSLVSLRGSATASGARVVLPTNVTPVHRDALVV